MKLNFNMSIDLSLEDLEEIITNYLRSLGYEVEAINYQVKHQLVGYGYDEHDETLFKGARVRVKKVE